MVGIYEISSDDGSNGDDPNKKPQEEENQNKNPQQQVQNPPIRLEVPVDLIVNILACIPRDRYPKLYLISKAIGQLITSRSLFKERSKLGKTERLLYTFIGFGPCDLSPRWYLLHLRNNFYRLSMISSLPPMILGSAVVTIGHDMYIIGGRLRSSKKPVSSVFVIDCRFHTWSCLPKMRRARHHAAAGVIDGKIYVIGGCIKRGRNWIEVFDVKKKKWETVPDQNPDAASYHGIFGPYVVMEEKIYILNGINCLAYEPRRGIWESWGISSQQRRFWHVSSSCVVDDMLYSIDPMCSNKYPIVVFDPRNVGWKAVKGVSKSALDDLDVYHESKMANFGGKLVILGRIKRQNNCDDYHLDRDIWCIVIALKICENGEIWGIVESNSRVLSCSELPLIELCRTVTV